MLHFFERNEMGIAIGNLCYLNHLKNKSTLWSKLKIDGTIWNQPSLARIFFTVSVKSVYFSDRLSRCGKISHSGCIFQAPDANGLTMVAFSREDSSMSAHLIVACDWDTFQDPRRKMYQSRAVIIRRSPSSPFLLNASGDIWPVMPVTVLLLSFTSEMSCVKGMESHRDLIRREH